MAKRTEAQHVTHLNELYTDMFTEQEAVNAFDYLTVKEKNRASTTEANIRKCHRQRTLGNLLKRCDPIAFRSGMND